MRHFTDIGPGPFDEVCASIGEKFPRGRELNRLECTAFITALRRVYGPEPDGAELQSMSHPHEFGSYREVRCWFEPGNEKARDYAYRCEKGVATWAAAGMYAPVLYDDSGVPTLVLEAPTLWLLPDASPTPRPATPAEQPPA